MRRYRPFILVVLAVSAGLITLSLTAGAQVPPKTRGEVAKAQVAKGNILVAQLPAGVEGVEISGGRIHLRPGYQFVEDKKNKTVAVRRSRGGLGDRGRARVKTVKATAMR